MISRATAGPTVVVRKRCQNGCSVGAVPDARLERVRVRVRALKRTCCAHPRRQHGGAVNAARRIQQLPQRHALVAKHQPQLRTRAFRAFSVAARRAAARCASRRRIAPRVLTQQLEVLHEPVTDGHALSALLQRDQRRGAARTWPRAARRAAECQSMPRAGR